MTASKGKSEDQTDESATKRRPVGTHEIQEMLIQRCGIPRLNTRDHSVRFDGTFLHEQKTLTADEISWLYQSLSCPKFSWGKQNTIDAVQSLATKNKFDPVAEYLESISDYVPLPMEQWENLDKYLLGVDNPVAAQFLPQFFISAVARVIKPGSESRCSPVLVGPQQRGKTTMGEILFGKDHWVEGLADLSKDSKMRCQTAWAVELSELDGVTRRSDLESLKTYLSEKEDSFRRPFGHGVIKYKRSFVFWGTSNHAPMRDLSGNTRFVCIGIKDQMLPLDWAIANRNALWARALEQYKSGVDWTSITEEQRDARKLQNLNFQVEDIWSEKVISTLEKQNGFCSLNTIVEALELPPTSQNSAAASRILSIVQAQGWTMERRSVKGVRMRGFWPPMPKEPAEKEKAEIKQMEEDL